jgi:hypothetical protein
MVWAVTNHGSKTTTGGAACTKSPVSNIAAGSLVVIGTMEHTNTSSSPSVSDTQSNTYTKITQLKTGVAANSFLAIWYSVLTKALTTSDTWTYTPVTSSNDNAMEILSATGNSATPLDTAVTATGAGAYATSAGSSLSVTSGTPAVSGELFVCFGGDTNSCRSINLDSTDGWAAPFDNNVTSDGGTGSATGVAVGGGYQVNSGTGTKKYNPTVVAGSPDAASIIVGFKAATVLIGFYNMPMLGM